MLRRRDPFREMMAFRHAFDSLFDNSIPYAGWDTGVTNQFAVDVSETEDEFEVKAVLPGIHPDDLEVTFSNNTLTIRGESRQEEEKEGQHYHLRERREGTFTRSVSIPSNIKTEDIDASYQAGILTLRLPKTDEVKPKRIPIKGGGQKMIEGKMRDKNGGS
jgi:HSP20 family protein